jgi:UDP-glucose 4-epimerase
MRVVIVGATGNVGTSLVEALSRDPTVEAVLGLARRLPAWRPPEASWAVADVRTDDLVPHLRGADAVVHLAWTFQPTRDPLVTWRNNVLGSIRVFQAAAEAKVPTLVYASSVGAYSTGPGDRAVDESWPTHALPTAAYGREKSYVERALDGFEAAHQEMRVVRLRPAFIFKRESASEQRRLFAGPLLAPWMVRPGLLPVVPDVSGLRFQALHSADAAEAFRLVVTDPTARGAYNLAAEPPIDARVLGELLRARPVRIPLGAARAVVSAAWRLRLLPASPHLLDLAVRAPLLDPSRIRAELGWRPRYTAVEAIRELLEGIRSGAGMATPPLEPGGAGRFRSRELLTRAGSRAGAA